MCTAGVVPVLPGQEGRVSAEPRPSAPQTPYGVVSGVAPVRRGTKREVLDLARSLEQEALGTPPRAALASLQDVRHLSRATRETYRALAEAGARCVLYARDLPAWVAPGVLGISLDDDSPLVDEWSVVLVRDGAPVALTATDLREPAPHDDQRAFLFAVSRDPEVVAAAAAAFPGGLAE